MVGTVLGRDLLEFLFDTVQMYLNSTVSDRKDCGDGDEEDSQAGSLEKGCKQGGKV